MFQQLCVRIVLLALFSTVHLTANAASIVLSDQRLHLRSGDKPEWDWFTNTPDARRFDVTFEAKANVGDATLFLRQDDVRHEWRVELNGKRLGNLHLMEADLVHTLRIPPATLRDGTNTLSIIPPRDNDDIVLHRVWIEPRPMATALTEATLDIAVTDATTLNPLPSRITIVDANASLAAIFAPTNAPLAVRPGVIYSGDGKARVGVPAGNYTIYATRGFEWSAATQRVHVASGDVERVSLTIRREVDTGGLVSCDTHIHTFTHSRHGDATTDERILTLAGEGIELPIATDHNLQVDFAAPAERMRVNRSFTPVTGNEVTTAAGHFNIFPVELTARVPDHKIAEWPKLMEELRATPNVRVVVLNHPRNVHNGFQPFAATNYNSVTGDNKRGSEFTFDAMELLNSSALQSDYMLVYRDWFALLNHGYRITAVGSSDGHDVSRYIVGQGRTYIACDDTDPARINVASACSNLLAGHASVSLGLLATMTVNDRFHMGDLARNLADEFVVSVRVAGPSWIAATNVQLFANGLLIREANLSAPASTRAGEKAVVNWKLPRPAYDVHLVAIATGPGVTAPFWATARPYQPSSSHWEPRVTGSTNPIWVDGDRDGKFTSARGYAKKFVASTRDAGKLIAALVVFDESVAAQAASLARASGIDLSAESPRATPAVQRGFSRFKETEQ